MSHSNQHLAQPGEDAQSAFLAETKIYKDWVAPTLNLLSLKINEVEKLRAENEVLKRQNRRLQDIVLKGKQKYLETPELQAVPVSSFSFIQQQQRDLEVHALKEEEKRLKEGIKELTQELLNPLRTNNVNTHPREEHEMLSGRLAKYQNHLSSRAEKNAESSYEDLKDDLTRAKDRTTMPESAQRNLKHVSNQTLSAHAGSSNDLNLTSKQLELEATNSRESRKQVQTTDTSGIDALSDLLVSDNPRGSAIRPVLPMRPNIQLQDPASPSQPENTSTVDAPRPRRSRASNSMKTKKKSKGERISRDFEQDLL